ncbi:type II toxin-antitoxin system VapC family toxin [Thermococcus gammatolerans]|uniref:Nucleotide binding protein, putative, containing PIN domain n=1 Tax=Thermococcus gammatolerans (strain DSM 15229 / JCM 11827 / EJ3) TaxID=593117 RepID=C5A5N1_THEGJ|nr:type II toxin-antitoxin system VapC family toxin [Thermococcus gammatolerans]ACS33543.1 Nucleotide binding protein, putative, containing PIN domain [Thermococcus gammatolerans EJ3]
MRFIDANVFLYALLKLKPNLPKEVIEKKKQAREILRRIENGEEVATTIVHLSEVANIIEAKVNLSMAIDFIEELLTAENVRILSVTPEDYIKATIVASEKRVSINDALAYLKMIELGISEIYTFDRHFLNLNVRVLP